MKFLTDRNLGKLTTWLRILGHDAVYYTGPIGREFLKKGAREARVVLTRRRDMARRDFSGHMFIIHADKVTDQLSELASQLPTLFDESALLSRCPRCNTPLDKTAKPSVKECVPPYIYEIHDDFMTCPTCGRIFWHGSHACRMHKLITLLRTAV